MMIKKVKDLKYLFQCSWQISKKSYLITLTKSIFRALVPLVNIVGLGTVINALVTKEPYREVIKIIIIYLSINLFIAIVREILQLLENNIMRVMTNVMQFDFSRDSVNVNYHYAQDRTILNLRRKSMSGHPTTLFYNVGAFLYYIVQLIGIIYIFSWLSPLFLLVLGITSTISIILIFKTKKNDFEFKNDKVEEDRKLDYLYDVMIGYKYAKEVRINNAQNYVANKYENIFKTQIIKLKLLFKKSLNISLASTVITVIQTALMYFYFSYQVYFGDVSIAQYTMLLSATTLLASILLGFFDSIAILDKISKAVVFYKEYKDLLNTQSNIFLSNNLEEKQVDYANSPIKFENVSFIYPGTEKVVLKNINIEIKKGEKIGLVGLNGSGKTTLVKLLTRLYDPTEGRITLNDIDIKEIPYCQYIRHVGVVLQDFLLFAYSVKENIVLDTEYDEVKFNSCIEKSGLKDKIDSLENNIDTSVFKTLDKNGVEFSGGEAQKLALARAIYKDAQMLVLDEPTSALDPIAEYELFSKLNNISENKTTIFISHRLSSTKFCDRIIVLSGSEVIESGSHNELINQNGFYANLFNAQAKYYKEKGVAVNE